MKKLLVLITSFLAFVDFSYSQMLMRTDDDVLKARAKDFISNLMEGRYSEAYTVFDSSVKKLITAEKLESIWKEIKVQYGTPAPYIRDTVIISGQYTVIILTAKFGLQVMDINCPFNSMGYLVGFNLAPNTNFSDYKPPEYAKQELFHEKEVKVGSGKNALSGTLTIPNSGISFISAVLVQGSGPHDRDETIGPNKPLKDLAWGLASKGIAVLRYEKRTKELPYSLPKNLTLKEEVTDDVLSAVQLLKTIPEFDSRRIFVIGHSLGAVCFPRVGKSDNTIAGFVGMAGSVSPLEDVILYQVEYSASLDGKIDDEEKKGIESLKEKIKKLKSPSLSLDTPNDSMIFGAPASYWLDLRGYNPAKTASELKVPILILHGKRDFQVNQQEYDKWKKELYGKPNVEFIQYPKLNHLFIEGEGICKPEEYETAGHIPEYVIDDIANWIRKSAK